MSAAPLENRALKIGPYSVKPAPTGVFGLDGGAMFGTVPRVLWQKSNPPDEHNRIRMEARALLLISPDRKILIDCGVGADFTEKYGDKLGPKFAEMYAVDSSSGSLASSLARAGVRFEDITDVVLTHLHFDHAGGATTWREGQLRPTFPNARYYVQRANLEAARKPNPREKASYYGANFEPLIEAGVLEILDGPVQDLLPGVSVGISDGHTRGQQWVKVSDGTETLVYCADLIPTSSHVRVPWIMGYDLHPLQIMDEKRTLLTQAAAEGWYLFFEHDPDVDAAKVEANRDDFAVKERVRFL